jgi:hypothetical protein
MAHDIGIRFKCRALFEVLDMTLSDISKQESVGISTLSDWKNDDREEFGGLWVKGSKTEQVESVTKKLREELRATSVYDEMQKKLSQHYGITEQGSLEATGVLSLDNSNKALQVQAETDVAMLASVQADWFDAQMFKNSLLSSIVLNNQVKKDITKVRQADIKASSEIHKMAKEARFGKTPDTVIFNANGHYTPEELASMSDAQLEELYMREKNRAESIEHVEYAGAE